MAGPGSRQFCSATEADGRPSGRQSLPRPVRPAACRVRHTVHCWPFRVRHSWHRAWLAIRRVPSPGVATSRVRRCFIERRLLLRACSVAAAPCLRLNRFGPAAPACRRQRPWPRPVASRNLSRSAVNSLLRLNELGVARVEFCQRLFALLQLTLQFVDIAKRRLVERCLQFVGDLLGNLQTTVQDPHLFGEVDILRPREPLPVRSFTVPASLLATASLSPEPSA